MPSKKQRRREQQPQETALQKARREQNQALRKQQWREQRQQEWREQRQQEWREKRQQEWREQRQQQWREQRQQESREQRQKESREQQETARRQALRDEKQQQQLARRKQPRRGQNQQPQRAPRIQLQQEAQWAASPQQQQADLFTQPTDYGQPMDYMSDNPWDLQEANDLPEEEEGRLAAIDGSNSGPLFDDGTPPAAGPSAQRNNPFTLVDTPLPNPQQTGLHPQDPAISANPVFEETQRARELTAETEFLPDGPWRHFMG